MLGIFDSGMGGLTVAHAIRSQAPQVDIVYFGDIAQMPYGNKSTEELEILTLRAMKFLRAQGAKHLVSACNSISTTVVRSLITLMGANETSITEMVLPTVRSLMPERSKVITIIATPAPVSSGLYAREFAELGISTHAIAIPKLAQLIEEQADEKYIRATLLPIVAEIQRLNTEILVLGCTHYPFVKELLEDAFRSSKSPVRIFDPADNVASEALMRHGTQGNGKTLFYTSQESLPFASTVQLLFNEEAMSVPAKTV